MQGCVKGKSILLIGDDAVFAGMATERLCAYGYTVLRVVAGEEAVEAASDTNSAFDIILVDIGSGSGIDAIESMSHVPESRDLPVIFLYSDLDPDIAEKTERLALYGYVAKDSGITVLDASIRTAIKLHNEKLRDREKLKESVESGEALMLKNKDLSVREAELLRIQQIANIGSWQLDLATNKITWTNELYRLYGVDPSLPPPSMEDQESFFTPESWKRLSSSITEIADTGTPYELELELVRNDNSTGWIWVHGEAVRDSGNRISHIWGAAQDITERKNADRAIRESEGMLKAIAENITSTIILSDGDGHITYTNQIPPGMTHEQIFSSTVYDFVPAETYPVIDNALRNVFKAGAISSYETFGPGKNGGAGIFKVTVSPVLSGETVVSAVFLADDITELKEEQQKIRQQLEEKEVILREAHHRIKNNIFSIESLLKLQAESTAGTESKTILRDAIGRVEGMRRLYDKMLLSESYNKISIKDYFEDLLAAVTGLFSERTMIKLESRFDSAVVDVKILFLLGIIVNELITNSMKYAFPDGNSGVITLNLKVIEDKGVLTVHDNGTGLPADFDLEKSGGFGLKLIRMLTKQLNGSLLLENSGGTKCTVTFSLSNTGVY